MRVKVIVFKGVIVTLYFVIVMFALFPQIGLMYENSYRVRINCMMCYKVDK